MQSSSPTADDQSWNYFESFQNFGSMLSDDERQNLKALGEKFYADIDMVKFKPKPAEEYDPKQDPIAMESERYERMMVQELVSALNSGLAFDDFTPEEQSLFKKYHDRD